MPAPKSKRKPGALPGLSGCLCGEDGNAGWWVNEFPVDLVADIHTLREFWTSLKPAARAAALKTTPAAEVYPQVVEALGNDMEEGIPLVMTFMTHDAVLDAGRSYFEQAMGSPQGMASAAEVSGPSEPVDEHIMVLPDDFLSVAVTGEPGQLPGAAARWGVVPEGHTVVVTKQGLVRFPDATMNGEAMAAVHQSMSGGLCKPEQGVHFRPWADQQESLMHGHLQRACQFVAALLVFFQRRLLRAKLRADAVGKQLSAGSQAVEDSTGHQTWSWGRGPEGQLGRGAANDSANPAPIPLLSNVKISCLSAAGNHAFALTDKGELLSWGGGQLGVTGRHEENAARTPLPCTVHVARGSPGQPKWGRASRVLRAVATGPTHTLALTADGRVHAWGAAWLGQLGNTHQMANGGCLLPYHARDFAEATSLAPGTPFPPEYAQAIGMQVPQARTPEGGPRPRPPMACVAILDSTPVSQMGVMTPAMHHMPPSHDLSGVVCVSAGGAHSAAVTADGNLLVWGCNDGGALGVALGTDHLIQPWVQSTGCSCTDAACEGPPKVVSVSSPIRVDLTGVVTGRVVEVACGSAISVARTDSGEVVSWGAAWRDPSRVDTVFPAGEVGAHTAAGGAHALAITQPGGQVFYWSRPPLAEWDLGAAMKLGGAPVHKSWHPKRVEFLEGATLGAISSTHAVVATRDGRVLLWQHGAALGKGAQASQYEVPALRGLSVLSLAAGDGFTLAATGPQQEVEQTNSSERAEAGAQQGAAEA